MSPKISVRESILSDAFYSLWPCHIVRNKLHQKASSFDIYFRKYELTHFRPMFHILINQWFLLAKCAKSTCGKWHFANKNQLHGFYISKTLVENELINGFIKVGLSPSKNVCVVCFIESRLKMMKTIFYFILKAHI